MVVQCSINSRDYEEDANICFVANITRIDVDKCYVKKKRK